jgi:hypothetical protein
VRSRICRLRAAGSTLEGMKHGFLRHFVEMLVAMVAGMVLLPSFATPWPYADGLLMATNMTLGMTIYMYYRGYSVRSTVEMGAAMYLPFLAGLDMMWAHVVMLPLMLVAMWRHHGEALTPRRLPARWPTLLALLMTLGFWFNPGVPPWLMMILPLAYIGFGIFRRQPLGLQFVGLVAYLALTTAALLAEPEMARYLVGAGWLAHAFWDWWHHKYREAVPKAYSEWCGVFDAIVGLTIIFLM